MKIKRFHYVDDYIVHCISEQVSLSNRVYKNCTAISIKEIADWKCKFSFFRHMLNKQKDKMIYTIGEDAK